MKEKAILSWSGGKDSTLVLHELTKGTDYEIVTLLTTLSNDYDRTCMHGIRRVMLEQQAQSLGIALEKVFISKDSPNEEYESRMQEVLEKHQNAGVRSVIFGDIFLEDLRKYRQEKLSKIGMKAVFPIWKFDTTKLANMFITSGFKAAITCVDSNVLGKAFAGRVFDERFLSELPPGVDPCGENGEFHTFVYDGPIFRNSIPYTTGEVVLRENRFYFCDLVPFEQYQGIENATV
ncbi:MAG: diphthine--ammonia ligase [Phycisphaerales bacterium]|jgi:uncharacterized protein (TIGR00290 family)